jgi:hypothetical protein
LDGFGDGWRFGGVCVWVGSGVASGFQLFIGFFDGEEVCFGGLEGLADIAVILLALVVLKYIGSRVVDIDSELLVLFVQVKQLTNQDLVVGDFVLSFTQIRHRLTQFQLRYQLLAFSNLKFVNCQSLLSSPFFCLCFCFRQSLLRYQVSLHFIICLLLTCILVHIGAFKTI